TDRELLRGIASVLPDRGGQIEHGKRVRDPDRGRRLGRDLVVDARVGDQPASRSQLAHRGRAELSRLLFLPPLAPPVLLVLRFCHVASQRCLVSTDLYRIARRPSAPGGEEAASIIPSRLVIPRTFHHIWL